MSELAGLPELRALRKLVEQHDKDLYRGNGKPGITTRMQQAEDWMKIREDSETVKRNEQWQVKFLLLSILLTQIVIYAISHK